MPLDFGLLEGGDSADTVLHPREIFSALPNKAEKYNYPRDVQTEVWNNWSARKNEKDLLLKLNTGAGKTVVGLLILKSCLNEGKGPAVYVAPDPFLVNQVLGEAAGLGIETTEDPRDTRYVRGRAVLVINAHKLINGQSVFGIGDTGTRIRIGSIVLDDAHACLSTAEKQFTLTLTGEAYSNLFQLFEESLIQQNPSRAMDVSIQEPYKNMLVPFWTWANKERDVLEIIQRYGGEEIAFSWNLLRKHLRLCRCVVGEGMVEISPRMLPISEIPAFASAPRRIFMSATLADDGVLVSHFDVLAESVANAITPVTANDIGERMILVPQDSNPSLKDTELRDLMVEKAKKYNVVVIVPSGFRAGFWVEAGARKLTKTDFHQGIEDLKNGHQGLVVIVNRYDGIDLPKDACRILVLDGLPDVRRKIDKLQEIMLEESDFVLNQRIQKIEQGMGRGIRSTEDHCVVVLMGKTLTNWLFDAKAPEKFSRATQAQLRLLDKLENQLQNATIEQISEAMDYCLGRVSAWTRTAKNALIGLTYEPQSRISALVIAQRKAFNAALIRDYPRAVSTIQGVVNLTENAATKGWLKFELAEYEHYVDPVKAQEILKSAVVLNPRLPLPIEGIVFQRLTPSQVGQAQLVIDHFKGAYDSPNHAMMAIDALLETFVFRPETSTAFEEAMRKLALVLGYGSQRPEQVFKRGPDVLWSVGELRYWVIEAKNGAVTPTINKHDCNQLNGSINWFEGSYDHTCHGTPVLVHPSSRFEHACSPHPDTRIITRERLDELREAIRGFAHAVVSRDDDSPANIMALLESYKLTPSKFLATYSSSFSVA